MRAVICRVQIWSPVVALVYWPLFTKIGLPTSGDYPRLRPTIRYMVSSSYSRVARENRSVGFQYARAIATLFVRSVIFEMWLKYWHAIFAGKNSAIRGREIFESSREYDIHFKYTSTFIQIATVWNKHTE